MLDLTLNELYVPDLLEYVPEFGTKIISNELNKGGLSTKRVHHNIQLPFSKQRPFIIEASEETGEIQYNANFIIKENVNLTLGKAAYNGCEVKVLFISDGSVTYQGNGGVFTDNISKDRVIKYTWKNGFWSCTSAPAVGTIHKRRPFTPLPQKIFGGQWEVVSNFSFRYEVNSKIQVLEIVSAKVSGNNLEITTAGSFTTPSKDSADSVSFFIETTTISPKEGQTTSSSTISGDLKLYTNPIIKFNKNTVGLETFIEDPTLLTGLKVYVFSEEAMPNSTGYIAQDTTEGYWTGNGTSSSPYSFVDSSPFVYPTGAFSYSSKTTGGTGNSGSGSQISFNLERGRKWWKSSSKNIYNYEKVSLDSIVVEGWIRVS